MRAQPGASNLRQAQASRVRARVWPLFITRLQLPRRHLWLRRQHLRLGRHRFVASSPRGGHSPRAYAFCAHPEPVGQRSTNLRCRAPQVLCVASENGFEANLLRNEATLPPPRAIERRVDRHMTLSGWQSARFTLRPIPPRPCP